MTQYKVKTPAFVPGFLNAMDALLKDDFQLNHFNAQPPVNIIEQNTQFDVVLSVPGLTKEDFVISLEKEILTVSYEKKELKEEETSTEKGKMIKQEFAVKSFKRSFTLNNQLNVEEISASYENGLLTISIPKLEVKEEKAKTIAIN